MAKYCPVCGTSVGVFTKICPTCGAKTDMTEDEVYGGSFSANENTQEQTSHQENGLNAQTQTNPQPKKEKAPFEIRFGIFRITLWDLALLLVCNLSCLAVIINAVIGGFAWCPFVALALLGGYHIACVCTVKDVKKFIKKYRNAVFVLNLVSGIFSIALRVLKQPQMDWATDYFIPVNLIVTSVLFLLLLINKNMPMGSVIFSTSLLLPQSFTLLVLTIICLCVPNGWLGIGSNKVSQVLIILAFAINVLVLANILVLYIFKVKNKAVEGIRWWKNL